MKRKLEKLNYRDEWASSKIPDHPYICTEIEADKLAFEVCCKSRKRRTKASGNKYLTLSPYEGLAESKSSLGESYARLQEIYRAPVAQRSFFAKKKPNVREQREKILQDGAKEEEEKYMTAMWQNLIQKVEARDKFQRLLEQNQEQTVQWRKENEQVFRKPEKSQNDQEKPTPVQIETDLMKVVSRVGRTGKERKKVRSVPLDEVLNTPLGKYEKNRNSRTDERFRELVTGLLLPAKNVKNRNSENKSTPQNQHQNGSFAFVNKTVPLSDPFEQMPRAKAVKVPIFYTIRNRQRLPVKNPKNISSSVGAKFSWHFRQKVKAKAMPKPKMSKPFDNLITGKNVEIPERMATFLSRQNIHKEINLKIEEKENARKPYKSRLKDQSEPNYGVYKSKTSRHMPNGDVRPNFSEHFHKMLRGKENTIPELNVALMSHHKIFPEIKRAIISSSKSHKRKQDESEPSHGVNKSKKSKHMPSGDIRPNFTEHFHKMLRGKENTNPELNVALMSHHKIFPEIKRAIKSSSGSHKRKQDESEPNHGVYKSKKSRHMPSGDIRPNFTEHFQKMLRGKDNTIPEVFPKITRAEKSSSGSTKGRLKYKFESSNRVSKRSKTPSKKEVTVSKINDVRIAHQEMPALPGIKAFKNSTVKSDDQYDSALPSSILKPKAPPSFRQISQDKNKRASIRSSRRYRPSLFKNQLRLQKFDYYIRNSQPDWRIVERRGSKDLIGYLDRKSIHSLISPKPGWTRSESGRPRGSVISTTDFARSLLDVKVEQGPVKAAEVERRDKDDLMPEDCMFDTVPEDYQTDQNQDPNLNKTLSELIADIVRTDKEKKTSLSKQRLKPRESTSGSLQKTRKSSSVSLLSVRDEVKHFEHLALEDYAWREQYQEEFVVEVKAAVQARIQELMKYVAIREDFQPPKPPRDFIRENIEMLPKMHPREEARIKKKQKPKKPDLFDFPESPYRNSNQQLLDTEHEPVRKVCCNIHEQQTKPKAPAETANETQKCDTFDEYSNPDSDFIQKTKPHKIREMERKKEALNHNNFEEWCPKYC
nr:uncharacterized protein LOC121502352 [Drosophila kikkawai]